MNHCIIGDCVPVMRDLIAQGVRSHLCVTSPPYDDLRTYGGYSFDFESIAIALYDIMVDGGIVCWNVGDSVVGGSETLTSAKQKIFFRERCGFRIHDTMIYEKLNFSCPEKVRYHQIFEYVFILSKGAPRCFNPIKDRPNIWVGASAFGESTKRQVDGSMSKVKRTIPTIAEFGMRTNIWRGKTAGQESVCQPNEHPAMMPFWLARDLIASWSNPGDVVIDPMAGSGTTLEAAETLGRQWIGIDVNPDYAKLQERRTAQQGLVL